MKLKVFIRSIYSIVKLSLLADNRLGLQAKSAPANVIISLTSIPSRLGTLHLTIKSLLNQNISFEKIILWLHEDLKTSLPLKLTKLQGNRFEILYCTSTEPHRKLVNSLNLLPDQIIVTCDDDMMYPRDWLSRLLESWQQAPEDIVAHMCRKIRIEDGEMMPYKTWRGESNGKSSGLTLALGWGGVLFPPGSLDDRVTDKESYMRLSPYADDLWFKAMAMLKGTEMRKSSKPNPEPVPIKSTQSISLSQKNIDDDQNRIQLLSLSKEYNLEFEE